MFGSQILDIAVGVIYVYLLFSILCSALSEFVAWILGLRTRTLEAGIRKLLNDQRGVGPAKLLYEHPLIKSLAQGRKNPAYIPSRTFALALPDVVERVAKAASPPVEAAAAVGKILDSLRATLAKLPDSNFKTSILALTNEAGHDLKTARKNIENWFDDSMDRVTGWYKRRTQKIILVLALIVSFGLNVDTFFIAKSLSRDAALRASLVVAAQEAVKQPATTGTQDPKKKIEEVENLLQKLQLPIGWPFKKDWALDETDPRVPTDTQGWLAKIAGLLFTMIALSLGAQFWFDVLNKVVNLRVGGKPPKEAPAESATVGDTGRNTSSSSDTA